MSAHIYKIYIYIYTHTRTRTRTHTHIYIRSYIQGWISENEVIRNFCEIATHFGKEIRNYES